MPADIPVVPPVSSTSLMSDRIRRGHPLPIGASVHREGVNFSIFSKHATACSLVLFEPGKPEGVTTIPLNPLTHRTGEVWHVFVNGLDAGARYGYRFDMQPNP